MTEKKPIVPDNFIPLGESAHSVLRRLERLLAKKPKRKTGGKEDAENTTE